MNTPRFTSFRRAWAGSAPALLLPALLLVLGGFITSSSFSGPGGPTPVWLSDGSDVIRQLDPETHTVLRRISLQDDVEALAVDPYDHSLWVLTEDAGLLQFSADGERLRNISLASYINDDDANYQPVLNPYGGNLWVGAGKTLLRLNPQGTPDLNTRLPDVVRQLAMGFDETLWVLTQKELISLSPAGQVTRRHTLATLGFANNDRPESIAVDSVGKVLWLATPRTLARFDTTIFAIPTLVRTQSASQPLFISPLTLNAFTGEVWLATGDTLLAFGRQGNTVRSVDLAAHNLKKPRSLVFEAQTQTLWLSANGGRIAHVAGSGALLGMLTTGDDDDEEDDSAGQPIFGVMPAHLLPTIKLKTPVSGSRINYTNPEIHLTLGALCNDRPCNVGNTYLSSLTLNISIDGIAVPASAWTLTGNDAVYAPGALTEGVVDIEGTTTDIFRHTSATLHDSFIIDLPPVITVTSPINGLLTNQREQALLGFVNEPVQLSLNGTPLAAPPPTQQFTHTLTLAEGINSYRLVAVDAGANQTDYVFTITLDSIAPAAATAALGEIVDGQVSVTGTAEAGATVTVTNLRTGVSTTVVVDAAGNYSTQIAAQGGDPLRIVVADAAGNTSAATDTEIPGGLPPDPSRVAPPVDQTTASMLATTTAFLYTGSDPIQTGVVSGTIEPKRAAVLRGKVMSRDNTPLGGVVITVQNHPEFGQTLSRADGMFDMAVNGGGYLTLNYSKEGFLPAQRQLNTPWQDFAHADEVVLIALDSKVTSIALNTNAMQVAQGNPVTDADGTRTATILFPAGTQATMTLPNGSTQTLTTLHVRATEYTVGENGPEAMPGPLPPTSGYTYAVELSVDEAVAAGAKTVRFNQPVPVYVDNFLNFPVGGIVPAGYYDRDKTAWIPSGNGRVIKILSIANSRAQLDTNGDGVADDAARLTALGVTDAEQMQLAALYTAGKTLWRVPITHFTPWDCNWPYGPPADAIPPQQPEPQADDPENDPCEQDGSIIECQNQILGERLPVTGTPFSLNYRSNRVPGRKSNVLDIPLSGASVPGSLQRIQLEIFVAGQEFKQDFPVRTNQTHRFEWDGKDAYGRRLQGAQPVTVRIGYPYPAIYRDPTQFAKAFALPSTGSISGSTSITAIRARQQILIWQEFTMTLSVRDARAQGLGGWNLSQHHVYDPAGQTLYLGDGSRRSAQDINAVIDTFAGNGSYEPLGDGGRATSASVYSPQGVAVDAQGNLFIADSNHARVRKVSPDGVITTLAGSGVPDTSGDGGPATAAGLYPLRVAADSRGNIFVADPNNNRVRKISPNGIISTVAGKGDRYSRDFGGDGGPATAASLNGPFGLAVDGPGNLYIVDRNNYRIRKVDTQGMITTIAGNGTQAVGGDGGPARAASLLQPSGIAVDSKGNLYIADPQTVRLRKITPDGIITTIAGTGSYGFSGDGGPATAAKLGYVVDVAVDQDDNVLIVDGSRVRMIDGQGIIRTVAGNGTQGFSGDGGPAIAAAFSPGWGGLAVGASNTLYLADSGNNRIRTVASAFPAFSGSDIVVPSDDGAFLYRFDHRGRHLSTLHANTGALVYAFAYSNGLLTQITDGDGNITRIDRDGAGHATALVAPDGQRTTLTLDANGYLAGITNPANETHHMTYTADGLLTRFTDPRGFASTMQYDANGKLIRDENAAGGFWAITRSELGISPNLGYEAGMTSAEGRTTRYGVEDLATGDERRTNTYPEGTQSVSLIGKNGVTTTTLPDGTVTAITEGPDPRFGMQAPITTSAITQTPGGLTSTTTATRTASLSNPDDLLSLITQTDTVTVNGKTARNVYTAATREHLFTSPQNRSSTLRTDTQGRPVFSQVPGVAAVTYGYDARGRLISLAQGTGAEARSMTYAYGSDGFVERITDTQNRATLYQRDLVGRITQSTLPGNRLLQMSYDAGGNVTSLTPPAKPAHSFTYTPVDLAEQYTPPTVTGIAAPATHYAYNRDKQITRLTRPDGQTIDFAYDTGGRLSSLTPLAPVGSASAEQITYGYAATTGQLASITTPTTTLTYAYDGFLLKNDAVSGSVSGNLARTYNSDFNVTALAVNGSGISFAYDNDALLTQAGALTFTRNAQNGFLTGTTLGNTTTTQTYNTFGEMNRFTAAQSASTLLDVQYVHDTLGRITTKTETLAGQTDVYVYGYDLAGRLISVSKNGAAVESYAYDANGNRTQGNGTATTHDDQDRLLTYGGNTYTYTANGELQEKRHSRAGGNPDVTRYTYDLFGNLRRATLPDATQIDYLIDGRNRRIGKKINGVMTQGFLYQNQLRIAAELDGNNNVVSRFVYGTKINVPEYMVRGTDTWRLITDHLGSARLVVNTATGAIAQRLDYDSFGNVTTDTNPGFQPFGFAGGLYDNDTKLMRFGARDYDAEIGRWTARDPSGFNGGDANLYAYTANDPVNWMDPYGRESHAVQPGPQGESFTGNDGSTEVYRQNICIACPDGSEVTIFPPGGDTFDAIIETNDGSLTIGGAKDKLLKDWKDEKSIQRNFCP